MKKEKRARFQNLEDLPIKVTDWIGSAESIGIHTIMFIGIFALRFFHVATDTIMLLLTTLVSLEAIYLSIFIQMTVNRNTQSLEEVEEDIDEIQEDIDAVEKDIDEIQEDVEGIEKDIDDIQEDAEEEDSDEEKTQKLLASIEGNMQKMIAEIDELKKLRQ
jgi:septal ring factor EnvC (AmiA/AmiB activator)